DGHLITFPLQQIRQRVGDGGFVFNDENPSHQCVPFPSAGLCECEELPTVFISISVPSVAASCASVSRAGSRMRKVDPLSTTDSTVTSPPWFETVCLTMLSPKPVPPVARERAESTR